MSPVSSTYVVRRSRVLQACVSTEKQLRTCSELRGTKAEKVSNKI